MKRAVATFIVAGISCFCAVVYVLANNALGAATWGMAFGVWTMVFVFQVTSLQYGGITDVSTEGLGTRLGESHSQASAESRTVVETTLHVGDES